MFFLPPNTKIGSYTIIDQIGSGSFSTVYRAKRGSFGDFDFALKIISKSPLISKQGGKQQQQTQEKDSVNDSEEEKSYSLKEMYQNEVNILERCKNCPFIIHMYDHFETENLYVIVLEYLQNGSIASNKNLDYRTLSGIDIDSYLQYDCINGFKEEDAKKIFAQIMFAIFYLHSELHVIHCDIKSENVIFDKHGNVRLADFGLAIEVDPTTNPSLKVNHVAGSMKSIAPEQFQKYYTCPKSDIWSAGVLLYELLFNEPPYNDRNMKTMAKKIMYQGIRYPDSISSSSTTSPSKILDSSYNDISEDAKDLIEQMLVKTPEERISCKEVLNHIFVKETWQSMQQKVGNFLLTSISQFTVEEQTEKLDEFSRNLFISSQRRSPRQPYNDLSSLNKCFCFVRPVVGRATISPSSPSKVQCPCMVINGPSSIGCSPLLHRQKQQKLLLQQIEVKNDEQTMNEQQIDESKNESQQQQQNKVDNEQQNVQQQNEPQLLQKLPIIRSNALVIRRKSLQQQKGTQKTIGGCIVGAAKGQTPSKFVLGSAISARRSISLTKPMVNSENF